VEPVERRTLLVSRPTRALIRLRRPCPLIRHNRHNLPPRDPGGSGQHRPAAGQSASRLAEGVGLTAVGHAAVSPREVRPQMAETTQASRPPADGRGRSCPRRGRAGLKSGLHRTFTYKTPGDGLPVEGDLVSSCENGSRAELGEDRDRRTGPARMRNRRAGEHHVTGRGLRPAIPSRGPDAAGVSSYRS
jgi:hypothetical protein